VLRAPPLAQHEREGVAEAERADRDEHGEERRADVRGGAAVEVEADLLALSRTVIRAVRTQN
jgi:hypothetical protein